MPSDLQILARQARLRAARTRRRSSWMALLTAFALSGVLGWQLLEVWDGSGTPSAGPRPLVMVAYDPSADSSAHDHTLAMDMRFDDNDDLRLTFWLEGKGLEKPKGHKGTDNPNWKFFRGNLTIGIALAQKGSDPIICGAGRAAKDVPYEKLSAGMRQAVDIDLLTNDSSALTPGWKPSQEKPSSSQADNDPSAAPTQPDPKPASPTGFTYVEYSTPIAMLSSDYHRSTRWEADEWVWAESCTIPAEHVWRSSKFSLYEQSSRQSFLIPQVNFVTSNADKLTVQNGIDLQVYLERKLADSLIYSKPVPKELPSSWWRFDLNGSNHEGVLFFTRQSVVILENTEVNGRRELILLLFGTVAGAIGTLFILSFKGFLSASVLSRQKDEAEY